MLTKFANKVYLLSYNACEASSFSAFKAGFWNLRRTLTSTASSYSGFCLLSNQTRNRPDLVFLPTTFLSISPANQYYTCYN